MQQDGRQIDHAIGPIDVGGLGDCDLLAAQGLSDDVEAAGERGVAEALRGVRAMIVLIPTIDFSGLESSVWAFASAVAIAATFSLERCMARLPLDQIEADRDYHLSLPTRRRSQFSLEPLS